MFSGIFGTITEEGGVTMSDEPLPLFPLQVVLFPGSSLPLHIFEERYKILIEESLRGSSEFGIALVTDQKIAEVGCTALVRAVARRYEDGRLDIVVEGKRRFRLRRYDQDRAPYLVGWVEFLPMSDTPADRGLSGDTIHLYNKLVSMVYKGKVQAVGPEHPQMGLSFQLAQKVGMDLTQRQTLLETESEDDRLLILHQYLQDVIPKLERLEEIERVVRGDGYL